MGGGQLGVFGPILEQGGGVTSTGAPGAQCGFLPAKPTPPGLPALTLHPSPD